MWFATRLQDTDIPYKRQVTVGFYIVDFTLPEQMLAVEIDGSMHNERYDKRRDEFLQKCGFSVLRVGNGDVGSVVLGAVKPVARPPESVLKNALPDESQLFAQPCDEGRRRACPGLNGAIQSIEIQMQKRPRLSEYIHTFSFYLLDAMSGVVSVPFLILSIFRN